MGQPRIGGYLISKLNLLFYSRVARLEFQVDWELVDVLGHVGVVEGRVQEEGGQHDQDEGQQRGQERDDRPRSPLRHGGCSHPSLLHGGGQLGHGGVQSLGMRRPRHCVSRHFCKHIT